MTQTSEATNDIAVRIDDLAAAYERHRLFPPLLGAGAAGRYGEDAVLQASRHHGRRAMGQDQVRGVENDLRAAESEDAGDFREYPVEADHHTDARGADIVHLERVVAGDVEEVLLAPEEMGLAVDAAEAVRPHQERAIVDRLAVGLGPPGAREGAALPAPGGHPVERRAAGRRLREQLEFLSVAELVAGREELGEYV